ncbi:MATE family efflux transporter [Acidaminococcus fermentans]|uniref:Probable multidrug resistance protein NorM n=1 Tax=Acidaminococcus fermentans (strain ATCC 25085 / DSM 20731 / CCUG 9996 / CIP 106432 / VR4) TaxID=591001 RepID=D2RJ19_ACIFV|nr:MATE family efflux transporter [Acidaminococcus fermentans]ADB47071.1 MATE efflux family protein [Acidaminococcus fermentans DSM 20731]MCI7195206.1 MATE family efflux transporter [Acidaminococcus fermentans]UEA72328.1 MATE family efflux transporter [Acidaminococcus fermentans DSM 20731]
MKNDYLITENPLKALLYFALPMIIGNFFQQTYTMADSAIVGRYVGEQALAAVGASYAFTNIFIWIAIGGGIGASVKVSRYFGAGQFQKMKEALYTALLTFLFLSLVLGGIGWEFSLDIMKLLDTPPDVLGLADVYLRVYFLGLPFLFMYSVLSAMFNALGKSRIPLFFLIFSSLFNVGLDWILVTRYGLGVAGVAWATLIAQGIAALLSCGVLAWVLRRMPSEKPRFFASEELLPMARIALPSILQQSTVSIGMMLVQSVVNGFGSEALAGFSAAMRVEGLCVVPMSAIGNAMSPYTAQNLGACRPERIPAGLKAAFRLVFAFALLNCLLLELGSHSLSLFFLGSEGSPAAFQTAENFFRFMGFFFCFIGLKMSVDGVLRGAGDMQMFTIANLVNLGLRVSLAMALAPRFGIAFVWYAVPLGWLANFLLSGWEYRRGKWRGKTMDQSAV